MTNPVLDLINLSVHALLHLVLTGAASLLSLVVFRPLALVPMAAAFVSASRSLALAGVGGVLALAAVRALWPALVSSREVSSFSGLAVRAVVAAGLMGLLPSALRLLFRANNLVVAAFGSGAVPSAGAWGAGMLAASPLWVLVVAVVLVLVVVYLSLLYVTRLIHIVWLAGLVPWFALWWLVSGDDGRLGAQLRELVALSLTQAVQAVAWWLALRYIGAMTNLSGLLFATGSLWFMVLVPHEFRHLLGTGSASRPRLVLW